MAKERNRYANPRRQPSGGGFWSSAEFAFGVTGGAISLTERRDARHRTGRRWPAD